jgi:hypothetical protein
MLEFTLGSLPMRAFVLGATLLAMGLADATVAPIAARERNLPSGILGYVTADSRFSGQSVRGPVRRGPQGRLEVRSPGGTWLECGRSCADTLRRETVDFWPSHGQDSMRNDGPGYLQFKW